MTTNVPCQQCNGPTRYKQFRSKAGKDCVIFECISGCMDQSGRFPLGTFPPRPAQNQQPSYGPRQPGAQPMQYPPQQPQQNRAPIQGNPTLQNETVILLRRMEIQLKNVVQMLQKLSGMTPIQQEELRPDDQLPPEWDHAANGGDQPPF